ncbi:cell division protein FtsN [Erwinia sp. E602]|uniref:cell division protein FtsN n=1 Tax=Erwinia sp. E602 TaxID=2675378 RepID=UPI001BA537CD|nr:cell division protein FtsN [Erwinia sp. E602]QUG77633.1 cell division protein FtsN [Erwinia sp. E602]
MAQKDYVSRGRSTGTRRKTTRGKKASGGSGVSKVMTVLAVAVLVAFVGGLWFIAHHKKEETPVIPDHKAVGNGLPPKPEERWRYIKELENRQLGVPMPTEPSAGGEVHSQTQLTDEQRQLLEQMQADMRQQPTQLNEVPWNEQTPAQRQQTMQRQQQQQNDLQQQARMQQQQLRQQQQQQQRLQQQNSQQQQTRMLQQQATQQNTQQQSHMLPQTTRTQQQPAQTPRVQQPQTQPTRQAPVTQATRETEVAAQPKAETKPKEAEKEKAQRWMVQCGSFKGTDQAESVRAQLAFEGFESRITSGGGWNRVVIGPYASRAAADSALKGLRGSGHANCIPLAIGG